MLAEFHEKFCFATVRQSGSWSLHVLDRHPNVVNGTTKTHPTTATKGDVSYLQCKAVGRNLQDLKRIAAQEFLSDVYLEHVKTMTRSV